jgi:hypothetical protein
MKQFKQLLIALMALIASYQSQAYELNGNYCWMAHEFRLVMPSSGTAKIDNYFPSLRDAIVAATEEAGVDPSKFAVNNGKTDTLFLYDSAKQGRLLGKVLITSNIACKTVGK